MALKEIEVIGDMPPYLEIAESLWGSNVNVDSDGDSVYPDSTNWTELTLTLREDESQRIDIDPVQDNPLKLKICSDSVDLVSKVYIHLREYGAVR